MPASRYHRARGATERRPLRKHAMAADTAAASGERGLLASDLLACLRETVNP